MVHTLLQLVLRCLETIDKKDIRYNIIILTFNLIPPSYTHTHIYTMVIQWRKWMLPKDIPIERNVYSFSFFEEITRDGFFLVLRTVSMTLFTDLYAVNVFFTGESLCFHCLNCLLPRLAVANPLVNIFFTKTYFSIRIIHSSVNFKRVALLSQQKFDERPLFKLRAHRLIGYHFE